MRAARSLWPKKTALELSMRTGVSERMAHYWLAQKFSISAEALASLLRSDAGLVVLENLMGEARPVWWRRIKRSASLSSLRAAQAAHQKQIEQYELMLGVIYARYLNQFDRAAHFLQRAVLRLHDSNALSLANDELKRIGPLVTPRPG